MNSPDFSHYYAQFHQSRRRVHWCATNQDYFPNLALEYRLQALQAEQLNQTYIKDAIAEYIDSHPDDPQVTNFISRLEDDRLIFEKTYYQWTTFRLDAILCTSDSKVEPNLTEAILATKQLRSAAADLIPLLASQSLAVVGSGSLAWGANYWVSESSDADFDLIIDTKNLAGHLEPLLSSLEPYLIQPISRDHAQLFAHHHSRGDADYITLEAQHLNKGIHLRLIPLDTLHRQAAFPLEDLQDPQLKNSLGSYRPQNGHQRTRYSQRDFLSYTHSTISTIFESGNQAHVATTPGISTNNGHLILGAMHDRYLSLPIIYYDPQGIFSSAQTEMASHFIARLNLERHCHPNLPLFPTNCFSREPHFRPSIKQRINQLYS